VAAKTASDLGADVTVFDFTENHRNKYLNINNLKFFVENNEKEQLSFI
jgi:hypothetical protein